MYSDAIMFSGSSLRSEPTQKLLITYLDLIKYRVEILQKPEQPKIVVVTYSGDLDLDHPIWITNRPKLIATSKIGYDKFCSIFSQKNLNQQEWEKQHQVIFKSFVKDQKDFDFKSLSLFLKNWDINFLDISSGPTLISLMIKEYNFLICLN